MTIAPVYTNFDPETGDPIFTLTHEDFEKVRLGYGCSYCLRDYNGIYRLKCPDCGRATLDIRPDFWTVGA